MSGSSANVFLGQEPSAKAFSLLGTNRATAHGGLKEDLPEERFSLGSADHRMVQMGSVVLPDGWQEAPNSSLWELLEDVDGVERGMLLFTLGMRALRQSDYKDALASLEGATAAFESVGAELDATNTRYNAGKCLWLLDRNAEAVATLEVARRGYEELGRISDMAEAIHLMGKAYKDDGLIDEAMDCFRRAGKLFEDEECFEAAGDAAMNLGEILGGSGKQEEALSVFQNARHSYRTVGLARKVAKADDRRAAALIDLGHVREALEVLRDCALVMESAGNIEDRAYAFYRLGWTLRREGLYEEALDHLGKSQDCYRELDEVQGVADCDLEIAHSLNGLDRYEEAEATYTRCRATFDALGQNKSVLLVDSGIAENALSSGDEERSIELRTKLIERASGVVSWIASGTASRLAEQLCDLGRFSQAQDVLEATEQDTEAGTDEQFESNLRRLAVARTVFGLKQYAQAKRLCHEGLEDLVETDFTNLRARFHELNANLIDLEDEEAATQEYAYALALFLADDDVKSAKRIATRFKSPSRLTLERNEKGAEK